MKDEEDKIELGEPDSLLFNYPKQPYTCPVCGGNGLVPNGFYNQTSRDWGTTSTAPEQCKSCKGSGIVWN